ncbi:hypothetical protein BaRGS_00025739 [Batillaria attramentaria]|uniref:Glycosylphosphatidylinositol anchor attachment 1 protein n=1 Tax=Batillaria attramentaria TaxID=370345 RepID=A0ABD0K7T6_9CAEN
MGLLTDPKQRQWLVRSILRYQSKLSVLLYVGGLLWFLALAYRPLNAGTYFSENALLPGLVESNLPQGFSSLQSFASSLKEEMKKDKERVPKDWIFQQFQDLGLDTYRQNFTLKYPFRMSTYAKELQLFRGENIYAILRARRAASTEALVMAAPLRSASNSKGRTDGGIALMLGLADQFRRNPYWAKDVIFLLSEMDEVGVLAWLDAYHESKSPYVFADDLPGRSGPIQAAINLEIPQDKVRYLNLKVEGLNGQLPNLDLFNLAVRLGRREHVHGDHHDPETWEGFQHMLGTMLNMMWTQASGAPSGSHGLFHRYHIEALTLEGVRLSKGMRAYSLEQLARVVEGIFRSLNNLLERFHQSFFFYLLPSTDRYVSIGLYMPPFGLMAVAALALWIMATSPQEPEDEKEREEKQLGEKETEGGEPGKKETKGGELGEKETETKKKEDSSGSGDPHNDSHSEKKKSLADQENAPQDLAVDDGDSDDDDGLELGETMRIFLSVAPVVTMSFLLGLMTYTAPHLFSKFEPSRSVSVFDVVTYGMMAVFTASLTYPYLLYRKADPDSEILINWHLLKCIGLLVQGLMLFAISLINISLAFFIAATSLPVMMAVYATKSWLSKGLQLVALLIVSPLGLLVMAACVTVIQKNTDDSWLFSPLAAMDEVKNLLFLLLVDQHLFASWTFLVVSLAYFPAWLLFWAIPFCQF